MIVFRLSRRKFSNHLSGIGASLYGARWNPKGLEMVYTSESRALALAEIAVHLSFAIIPADYLMVTVYIPDHLTVYQPEMALLPAGWDEFPYNEEPQLFGRDFLLLKEACVMKVPSAVVKGDYNYLINPPHPDFKRIRIIDICDFILDRRLMR